MNKFNLLQKAKKTNIVLNPYPHIIIEDALPEDVYEQLSDEFPETADICFHHSGGIQPILQNKMYQMNGIKSIDNPKVSTLWQDFVRFHVSKEFYDHFIKIFGDTIKQIHPWLEKKTKKKLEDFKSGLRKRDKGDILLDAQIRINSPVLTKSSVKGIHLDAKTQLFGGMLYMRDDSDKSSGGQLRMHKHRGQYYGQLEQPKINLISKRFETLATVPYKKNLFVLFLCNQYAFHSVADRDETEYPRRLVNIIGENFKVGGFNR